MLINDRIATKNMEIYSVRVTDVVFEGEYLSNEWVKKDRINANLV